MAKVITQKNYEGNWTVFNRENGKCADIIEIAEYGILKGKKKYRVDYRGKTIESMLTNWQKAKSIAMAVVKEG